MSAVQRSNTDDGKELPGGGLGVVDEKDQYGILAAAGRVSSANSGFQHLLVRSEKLDGRGNGLLYRKCAQQQLCVMKR